MTRRYLYVEATTADLHALPCCRYVEGAGRGHGPELWFDNAEMPRDYPSKVALVRDAGDGTLLVVAICHEAQETLTAALPHGMTAAGKCAALKTELAAAGHPVEALEAEPTSVCMCLTGDDPETAADPDREAVSEVSRVLAPIEDSEEMS